MYGVGIYLYFAFLKHIAILFFILTLVSIPPIIMNGVKGNTYLHSQIDLSIILSKSSLGSHNYLEMPNGSYDASINFKIVNAAFDIIACAIFLAFIIYWEKKSKII
jgi:hypothetical protein